MDEKKLPETYSDLSNAFLELFDTALPNDADEIDAFLRELGFDPVEVGANIRGLAEEALASSPLNWRVQAARELEAERARFDNLTGAKKLSRSEILAQMQALLSRVGAEHGLVTAHRNLEEASDEDLASLLDELLYLVSPEQQEEKDDKQ